MCEDAAVRVAHAHGILVDIDAGLVDAAELELVHQVVVHLFAVYLHAGLVRVEGCEAVGETFLDEVVVQAELVLLSYADGDVDGTLPVGFGQHFEHHQLALVEGALGMVVALRILGAELDRHVVGDGVARQQHAAAAYGFLVHLDDHAVRGDYLQFLVLVAYPVLQDVLQFVGILTEFLLYVDLGFGVACESFFFGLRVEGVDALLVFGLDSDVFVGSLDVVHAVPGDGERRRVVGRTLHLVDVPVGVEVRQVAGAGVGAEAFGLLVVPQGESIVVAIGVDDGVAALLERHQVVLPEVACHVAVAAVVVVPGLAGHLDGDEEADDGDDEGNGQRGFQLGSFLTFARCFGLGGGFAPHPLAQQLDEAGDTHADPDGKGVERTGVSVVAFTRLAGRLVQVEHDGDTRHEE